jgi:hypothetical protein
MLVGVHLLTEFQRAMGFNSYRQPAAGTGLVCRGITKRSSDNPTINPGDKKSPFAHASRKLTLFDNLLADADLTSGKSEMRPGTAG